MLLAHMLFDGVVNVFFNALGRPAFKDHECDRASRGYNWRRPSAIAEAPKAEALSNHVRVSHEFVVDRRHVRSPFGRSVLLPITRRPACAALVVTDDVHTVENEIGNDEAHFASFGIVAVDQDDRRTPI